MAKRIPLGQRFWGKVRVGQPDECWPWLGRIQKGYGVQWMGRGFHRHDHKFKAAHRLSFELANAVQLREEHHLHHVCENKSCVNPFHLRMLSQADHNRLHGAQQRMLLAKEEYAQG